ncbi:hypothetical protein VNO80_03139 [Phaseolus coccineus]|uniref:Uncharacterized protein n=1 Tax=Phaseolus coccineus TaxID=3886 RepID=A0AAN9NY45_PHACN
MTSAIDCHGFSVTRVCCAVVLQGAWRRCLVAAAVGGSGTVPLKVRRWVSLVVRCAHPQVGSTTAGRASATVCASVAVGLWRAGAVGARRGAVYCGGLVCVPWWLAG